MLIANLLTSIAQHFSHSEIPGQLQNNYEGEGKVLAEPNTNNHFFSYGDNSNNG